MTTAPLKVWVEHEGHLLRLRLARPKANVVDAEMIAALDRALADHLDHPALRAVLLDADGPHFSFGASVEEHLPAMCAEMLTAFHGLILRIVASPVPVMAAVQGRCLGGGLEVAMAAHLIFVAPDAVLAQPEINIGVFAPAASCLMPERIGRAAAEDLLISGRNIDGDEAKAIGLATAVAENPESAAIDYFTTHLAGKSASSLRYATRAARFGLVERLKERLDAFEQLYNEGLMTTQDAVEGLEAFLEKRPAVWKDR
jgi:cyclohexa-1,5-dienecarbonyl-CoA hydratase